MRSAVARGLAWSWLAALVALVLVLRFAGERWWPLVLVLYLPRVAFGLPLLVILPLSLGTRVFGPRGTWLPLGAALLVLLFPLMGLRLSWPVPAGARVDAGPRPSLRVMSYNVWYGHFGADAILREVEAAAPDVIALQAWDGRLAASLRRRFPGWQFHEADDFFVASRFPIREVLAPPAVHVAGGPDEKPAFIRYTIDSPLGRVDLFNTHPYSARDGLFALRDGEGEPARRITGNVAVRRAQVIALAGEAARSTGLVIIAGDTNLPDLSELLEGRLGRYADGFASAGSGFGYTFPAHRVPWLRIDRILVGEGLRVTRFVVGGRHGSDHCPVIADLALADF